MEKDYAESLRRSQIFLAVVNLVGAPWVSAVAPTLADGEIAMHEPPNDLEPWRPSRRCDSAQWARLESKSVTTRHDLEHTCHTEKRPLTGALAGLLRRLADCFDPP